MVGANISEDDSCPFYHCPCNKDYLSSGDDDETTSASEDSLESTCRDEPSVTGVHASLKWLIPKQPESHPKKSVPKNLHSDIVATGESIKPPASVDKEVTAESLPKKFDNPPKLLKMPAEVKSQKSFIKTKTSDYVVGNVVDCSKKINGCPMLPGLVVATMDGPVRIGHSGHVETYQVKPTSVLDAKQDAHTSTGYLGTKAHQQPSTDAFNVKDHGQQEPSTSGLDANERSLFISLSESDLRSFTEIPLNEDENGEEAFFEENEKETKSCNERKGIFKFNSFKSWMRKKIRRLNCFKTTSDTYTINQV